MAETISARDANQNFAKVLKAVEAGSEYVVTRHGQPVARIVPVAGESGRRLTPVQEEALARSMDRLRRGWSLGGARLDRDALHER